MADDKTIHCSLITPDRIVFDSDATFAAVTAHDGEIGFLHDRAPLLCKLGFGELRVKTASREHRFYIEGGFAQMLDNQLSVLTERAESVEDIDRADAQSELNQASSPPSDVDRLAKARAKLRVATKRA